MMEKLFISWDYQGKYGILNLITIYERLQKAPMENQAMHINKVSCRICGQSADFIFRERVLNKYDAGYFHCGNCGFLQTETPYWRKEAYAEAIPMYDTGIIFRNLAVSRLASIILFYLFDKNGLYLDYAGGYGFFTRIMRDIGFDYYWQDKYAQNILARGFECDKKRRISLITALEIFEHFEDPVAELEKMFSISRNVLFSTELLPAPVPKPDEWWYYVFPHGQHISFYSERTLHYLAERFNSNFYSFGMLHLFTEKKISGALIASIKLFRKIRLYKYLEYFLYQRARSGMRARTVDDMNYLISKKMDERQGQVFDK